MAMLGAQRVPPKLAETIVVVSQSRAVGVVWIILSATRNELLQPTDTAKVANGQQAIRVELIGARGRADDVPQVGNLHMERSPLRLPGHDGVTRAVLANRTLREVLIGLDLREPRD